ncbi:MAG: nitroreductase family deazaflavin-dependent oxidoreductase [Actinomycetota bacterium]|nr:nitroreductase family deazaflavin-dependent oxidoreductase [Actinomycetota bacterium]
MRKLKLTNFVARHFANPIVKLIAGYVPFWSLLETKGRTSGEPRRTPVGNGLEGDTFWIVSEHGRNAQYIKNIQSDPRVRVRVGGRWRTGTAHLMPDDDPRARQRRLGRFNSALVRVVGTDLLTVRIDLDTAPPG